MFQLRPPNPVCGELPVALSGIQGVRYGRTAMIANPRNIANFGDVRSFGTSCLAAPAFTWAQAPPGPLPQAQSQDAPPPAPRPQAQKAGRATADLDFWGVEAQSR